MQIDIRNNTQKVDTIVFAEDDESLAFAHQLYKSSSQHFSIQDGHEYVNLKNKADTLNLIKALNKAIELKWVV